MLLARTSLAQLLALEAARLVLGDKGGDAVGVDRALVDVEAALVGDVEDHQLRRRGGVAELGELTHLVGDLPLRPRHEVELLAARCLGRLGDDAHRRSERGLRLGRRALHHHAHACLVIEPVGPRCHVVERLGPPRELLALRVAAHRAAPLGVDRLTGRTVHEHQGGDALHLEPRRERGLALVARRDGQPRHRREVLLELSHVLVARDEDHLELLACGLDLLVGLDQQRREGLARRAPVRREVEADHLALAAQCGELDRLTVARHELVAHRLPDRWRLPREVLALEVLHHSVTAVLGDQLARLAVEDDQRRDARDLELLRQRRLELALGVGQSEPRLLTIVLVEGRLLTVARDEDDLEALARRHEALVGLGQLRREPPARRAPVRREVEGHRLLALERLGRGDLAVLGLERLTE
mmetsp:Transcript_7529/g.17828  ORF Transcript_7529/g.17828 Transcript_7529/m.17828 type:complete len:414 (-) Transcript_7529:93-1334(-)